MRRVHAARTLRVLHAWVPNRHAAGGSMSVLRAERIAHTVRSFAVCAMPCRCGSNSHKRISHHDCPLNAKKRRLSTNDPMTDGKHLAHPAAARLFQPHVHRRQSGSSGSSKQHHSTQPTAPATGNVRQLPPRAKMIRQLPPRARMIRQLPPRASHDC